MDQRQATGAGRSTLTRRDLIFLFAGAAAVWPISTRGQQKPSPVIGFLGIGSPSADNPAVAAFNEGLNEVGWTVGQNVTIEYRWAEGHFDRLSGLAGELVGRNVTVIATTGGTLAARAAKTATATIPIVFEAGIDPVEAGLVQSFAHPGGT
jgi:ABC-type uncharacterized transport system substrate-binding protein